MDSRKNRIKTRLTNDFDSLRYSIKGLDSFWELLYYTAYSFWERLTGRAEDKHESNRISQPHHGTLTRGKATEEVRAWARRTHGTPGAAYSGRSVPPLAPVGGYPWD